MEAKKLFRKSSNKVIAGVCSGLGEYLNLDPVLIRVIFILLLLFGLSGGLIYIIMWIIVPLRINF